MTDSIFVVPLLKDAGTVLVNSGGTVYELDAPKGASAYAVDMKLGVQSFTLNRNGASVISATSLREIKNECPCGIYNFNAYVGTVPAPSTQDVLQPNGLQMFTNGLKVSCQASPSLPASPPPTAAPTTTVTATVVPTLPV